MAVNVGPDGPVADIGVNRIGEVEWRCPACHAPSLHELEDGGSRRSRAPDPDLAQCYDRLFPIYVATREAMPAQWRALAEVRRA